MSHSAAGAQAVVRDRDAVVREAQAWAAAHGVEVLLADASVVFGRDHLESAAMHAERARAAGVMATRSLSMEALLYLAGKRQVADAIEASGLRTATKAAAVLVFGDAPADDLIAHLGWTRDDGVLSAAGKDLRAMGIRPSEQATVPRERATDLALERTALVDVMK